MTEKGTKDIKEVHRKLSGRYKGAIVRKRADTTPPFITITDGAKTNLRVERGEGLFGWEVSGKMSGRDIDISASNDRELVRKIDDRMAEVESLRRHLGIEEIV